MIVGALLLIPPCGNHRDRDVDTSTYATDSDTDWARDGDTGVAVAYWTGELQTADGDFSAGSFGFSYLGLGSGEWVCVVEGALDYEDAAPEGCPDCAWAFNLSAIGGSTAEGSACGDLAWSDGGLDGYFDYSWGFAASYTYDWDGTPLYLEDNVLLYLGEWFVFAFSLPSYGVHQTSGDASDVTFARPLTSDGEYVYYYYYP